MQHHARRSLKGIVSILLTFFLVSVMACQSTKKNASADSQNAMASACTVDGRGTWSNNSCYCTSGWSVDSSTGRCTISSGTTRTPQDGCQSSSGTWNGTSCTCPSPTYWDSINNLCSSNTGTSGMSQVTQAQCQTASSTGAYWNGSVCLCQNASYPYWNPSAYQCSSTQQSTTSVVGTASQTQCSNASATGAYWNGQACQCTNANYPYWNASQYQCSTASLGNTTGGTIPGQGSCTLGQLQINGQCTSIASLTNQSGCQATGGTWAGLIVKSCRCASGLEWYPPLKTCQSLQSLTGVGPSLCAATGGQSVNTNQCTCPANTRLYRDSLTRYLFCG